MQGVEMTAPLTAEETIKNKTFNHAAAKGDDETIIYWQEDFSNGFDGMGENGAWSTDEDQGDLWFITYPVGAENGYDPALALQDASDLYGTQIPNYFGERDVCASPTRDNGVVMIDGDRWNSTSTEENPDGSLTQNPFLASLISPVFSLEGVDNALLTWYHYSRVCCSGYSLSADLSVDNGETWIPYDAYTPYGAPNENVDIQVSIDISDVLQSTDDLSECRLRFFWNGSQSHYFWSIDDIAIVSLPDNDLIAGETWYNNYFDLIDDFEADENPISAAEYFGQFEYLETPDYQTRPFNFAMEVTNAGINTQTNVVLHVDATAPDGTVYNLESDPVEIPTATGDTLWITDVTYDEDLGGAQYGQWLFDYYVTQDQEDERPEDNVGQGRGTVISTDAEDEYSYFRNGENSYGGAYINDGQDRIFGTAYAFAQDNENDVITHVEAVFLYSEDFAETIAGEVVYFNVRSGSVLEEDPEDPETATSVFFDSDNPLTYEDGDLEYTIEEEFIWQSTDGQPFVWASFELPTPVAIEPGQIYQVEYRIPAAGDNVVFSPAPQGDQEQYSSVLYDFEAGQWSYLVNNALPLRFRTANPTNVEGVTYDAGVKLIQNYPNPFNSFTDIQYQLDETEEATFELRDITGKLVFSEDLGMVSANNVNIYRLEKGSLSAGVYTYSIVTADGIVTRKLTVE